MNQMTESVRDMSPVMWPCLYDLCQCVLDLYHKTTLVVIFLFLCAGLRPWGRCGCGRARVWGAVQLRHGGRDSWRGEEERAPLSAGGRDNVPVQAKTCPSTRATIHEIWQPQWVWADDHPVWHLELRSGRRRLDVAEEDLWEAATRRPQLWLAQWYSLGQPHEYPYQWLPSALYRSVWLPENEPQLPLSEQYMAFQPMRSLRLFFFFLIHKMCYVLISLCGFLLLPLTFELH